jgi:hypothetical protein
VSRCQSAAGRRLLVAGWPWVDDLGSVTVGRHTTSGRRTTGDQKSGPGRWLSGDQRSPTPGRRPKAIWRLAITRRARVDAQTGPVCPFLIFNFFFSCPPLFVQLVNFCWLASAHARPGQTLPKNFKHP